jgi:hypothetical protein
MTFDHSFEDPPTQLSVPRKIAHRIADCHQSRARPGLLRTYVLDSPFDSSCSGGQFWPRPFPLAAPSLYNISYPLCARSCLASTKTTNLISLFLYF